MLKQLKWPICSTFTHVSCAGKLLTVKPTTRLSGSPHQVVSIDFQHILWFHGIENQEAFNLKGVFQIFSEQLQTNQSFHPFKFHPPPVHCIIFFFYKEQDDRATTMTKWQIHEQLESKEWRIFLRKPTAICWNVKEDKVPLMCSKLRNCSRINLKK